MNYRHAFHAGNICDTVKHVVLTIVIDALHGKDKAFCVLDSHAGIGLYDLQGEQAQKTLEAQNGIVKFLQAERIPDIEDYYNALLQVNSQLQLSPDETLKNLRFYPGSPLIARAMLRPQDRLMACELHEEDYKLLRRSFRDDKQVQIHHRDGYDALSALLPPPEKRGLALIDPPFEQPDEFLRLSEGAIAAHTRWPQGVIMLWYPVKDRPAIWRFTEAFAGIPETLNAEFVYEEEVCSDRLIGCGFVVINPPWRLDERLKALFPALHEALGTGYQSSKVSWLSGD